MVTVALVPRPWLDLYGVHVRVRNFKKELQVDLAPIQQALPDELIVLVLGQLPAYTLGKVACVCRQLRQLVVERERLWEPACREALQACVGGGDPAAVLQLVRASYRGSWRRAFLEHPHLRFDGLYVSRNTYIRTGAVEWTTRNAVHLVTYYRYYRFFSDGTFLYRTSPQSVAKAAKMLYAKPAGDGRKATEDQALSGRYALQGSKLFCVVVHNNREATQTRSVLRLRSTRPGANDRLDIERIFSFDPVPGGLHKAGGGKAAPDPEDVPGGAAGRSLDHQRGMACAVLVTWDNVATSPLNLSATQMDYYVPG